MFRRRPPTITGPQARAIAEAACDRLGRELVEPVTLRLYGWRRRTWCVRGRSDVIPSGPNVYIDARTGEVCRVQQHLR